MGVNHPGTSPLVFHTQLPKTPTAIPRNGMIPNNVVLKNSFPYGSTRKWQIQMFPFPMEHSIGVPPDKPNTGCGARLHTGTSPNNTTRTWSRAYAVVPLSVEYFSPSQQARLSWSEKSECGCVTVGIGCRIWYRKCAGNPKNSVPAAHRDAAMKFRAVVHVPRECSVPAASSASWQDTNRRHTAIGA
ncbi:hypothetical protein C8J57DRAFT_1237598 [Mycena rebaudengoi]|nr:hypothetical protein C8J57DRAFT_1237598 [Mycena rebaudengoi]